jgi:hypothetical protein
MPTYRVKWEIDIWADDPLEAAVDAQRIQRKPGTTATVFQVQIAGIDPQDLWDEIDLTSDES